MTAAGDLTARVRLERRAVVDDGYGNPVSGDWVPQFSRRAKIMPSKGTETVMAARLQGRQPALIILRYDAETRMIGADWRVVEIREAGAEVVYAIRDARDMESERTWMTLLAEAGVADG